MCVLLCSHAVQGEDFNIPSPITVTFPAGSANGASTCVTVTILDDDDLEGDHSFTLHLSNPSPGAIIGSHMYTTVDITDNGMPE